MSNREKIFVILMAAAVLYGAYAFLFSSPPRSEFQDLDKRLVELKGLVTSIAGTLKKEEPELQNVSVVIARASAGWDKDPFLEVESPEKAETAVQGPRVAAGGLGLVYSGYLEAGDKRLAVINGLGYEVGEKVGSVGHVITSISPTQVVLEIKGTAKVILPMEEPAY